MCEHTARTAMYIHTQVHSSDRGKTYLLVYLAGSRALHCVALRVLGSMNCRSTKKKKNRSVSEKPPQTRRAHKTQKINTAPIAPGGHQSLVHASSSRARRRANREPRRATSTTNSPSCARQSSRRSPWARTSHSRTAAHGARRTRGGTTKTWAESEKTAAAARGAWWCSRGVWRVNEQHRTSEMRRGTCVPAG